MTNCYFQHCTSHMLRVLNGKQRILIKLIIKIVLMACLMCFHTDLERKLSVRTTREDLIKKGILPVTNEGNRSLLHLLWHGVWFQTCYKYLLNHKNILFGEFCKFILCDVYKVECWFNRNIRGGRCFKTTQSWVVDSYFFVSKRIYLENMSK